MNVDMGSRDPKFLKVVASIRETLLRHAGVTSSTHACVLMQGAGTQGVESMLTSLVPRTGGAKMLVVNNGAYGARQEEICTYMQIPFESISYPDNAAFAVSDIEQKLKDGGFSHVSVIHHETTSGVLNPVKDLGLMLRDKFPAVKLLVDSMSAFGAYEAPVAEWNIHAIVSSANKNYEGAPGFSFVICEKEGLRPGVAGVLSLDLHAQWSFMEEKGQFRFTPPCQAIMGFQTALEEWEREGGLAARAGRYKANRDILVEGLQGLGFVPYVAEEVRGHIITGFLEPTHPKWDFLSFYNELGNRGFVIYPGSKTKSKIFRIGSIGRVFPEDMRNFVAACEDAMRSLGMPVPIPPN